jgi:hypothetical protein
MRVLVPLWEFNHDSNLQRSYFDPHIGYSRETLLLFIAACLLFWVLTGGLIMRGIISLLTKAKNPKGVGQLPKKSREEATISQLGRPDGSQLRVECYAREDAPPIILTHWWRANSTEWDYLKEELADEFRLIVWDLPGLGRSTRMNRPSPLLWKLLVWKWILGIDSEGMATAINMENVYDINVLRGEAKFRKNGADCDPVVIHFSEMPIS